MTAFSRWEKELPKLVSDARFTAVPSMKERRMMFDAFCRSAADTHRRPKPDRARAKRDAFNGLLDEAAALVSPQNGACPPAPASWSNGNLMISACIREIKDRPHSEPAQYSSNWLPFFMTVLLV